MPKKSLPDPLDSYLIRTDTQTILFDVGHNQNQTSPSVLQHNMQELGIALDDIDTIFLSHNHLDHVGGLQWSRMQSFSLGNRQIDLGDVQVYSPTPMTYPGLVLRHTPEPQILARGIATTGTIAQRLFIGAIEEQALAINVEGKGVVLIVGCGHQTIPKILQRAKAVFSEPVYGLIGDLHYPVPQGRFTLLGIDVQRTLASGEGEFIRIWPAERNPVLIGGLPACHGAVTTQRPATYGNHTVTVFPPRSFAALPVG